MREGLNEQVEHDKALEEVWEVAVVQQLSREGLHRPSEQPVQRAPSVMDQTSSEVPGRPGTVPDTRYTMVNQQAELSSDSASVTFQFGGSLDNHLISLSLYPLIYKMRFECLFQRVICHLPESS